MKKHFAFGECAGRSLAAATINEGTILEYPSSFTTNLNIGDRIVFMEELKENIASGRIIGRIARPSALSIPDYLTVYIDKNGRLLIDTTREFVHDAYYCSIHITEGSICRAFLDFTKSIIGSQLLYSMEALAWKKRFAFGECAGRSLTAATIKSGNAEYLG